MNILDESSLTLLLCLRVIFQSRALKSAECKTVCAEGTTGYLNQADKWLCKEQIGTKTLFNQTEKQIVRSNFHDLFFHKGHTVLQYCTKAIPMILEVNCSSEEIQLMFYQQIQFLKASVQSKQRMTRVSLAIILQ